MCHIDFERILKTTNKSCWSEVTLENDILHSRMEGVKDHEMEDRNFLTDNHVTRVQRLETIFIEYFELEVFGFINPTVVGISTVYSCTHKTLLACSPPPLYLPCSSYALSPRKLVHLSPLFPACTDFFRSTVHPHLPPSSRSRLRKIIDGMLYDSSSCDCWFSQEDY